MTLYVFSTTPNIWNINIIDENWKADHFNDIIDNQKYLVLFTNILDRDKLHITSLALVEINQYYLILDVFIVNNFYHQTKLSLFHQYQIIILLLQYYKSIQIHYLELRSSNQSALSTYAYYGYKIYLQRINYYSIPNNHAILLRINNVKSLNYWRCKSA